MIKHFKERPIRTTVKFEESQQSLARDLWKYLEFNIELYGDIVINYFLPKYDTNSTNIISDLSGVAVYGLVMNDFHDNSRLLQWLDGQNVYEKQIKLLPHNLIKYIKTFLFYNGVTYFNSSTRTWTINGSLTKIKIYKRVLCLNMSHEQVFNNIQKIYGKYETVYRLVFNDFVQTRLSLNKIISQIEKTISQHPARINLRQLDYAPMHSSKWSINKLENLLCPGIVCNVCKFLTMKELFDLSICNNWWYDKLRTNLFVIYCEQYKCLNFNLTKYKQYIHGISNFYLFSAATVVVCELPVTIENRIPIYNGTSMRGYIGSSLFLQSIVNINKTKMSALHLVWNDREKYISNIHDLVYELNLNWYMLSEAQNLSDLDDWPTNDKAYCIIFKKCTLGTGLLGEVSNIYDAEIVVLWDSQIVQTLTHTNAQPYDVSKMLIAIGYDDLYDINQLTDDYYINSAYSRVFIDTKWGCAPDEIVYFLQNLHGFGIQDAWEYVKECDILLTLSWDNVTEEVKENGQRLWSFLQKNFEHIRDNTKLNSCEFYLYFIGNTSQYGVSFDLCKMECVQELDVYQQMWNKIINNHSMMVCSNEFMKIASRKAVQSILKRCVVRKRDVRVL